VKTHGLAQSLLRYRLHLEAFDMATLERDLAGKDLACRCPLGQPCHADLLLELANPRAARVATDQLNRRLLDMAIRGEGPRCSDPLIMRVTT
jgi:hypothetical protein